MTREEASFYLANMDRKYMEKGMSEALDIAIEALEQHPCDDCISRQSTVKRLCKVADFMNEKRSGLGSPYIMAALFIQDNKDEFPSVTPLPKRHGKLTNHEWIDFLTEQFDISHTSAKEMLHAMMSVKKEDNFKKQFSQGKKGFSQGFSQGRK